MTAPALDRSSRRCWASFSSWSLLWHRIGIPWLSDPLQLSNKPTHASKALRLWDLSNLPRFFNLKVSWQNFLSYPVGYDASHRPRDRLCLFAAEPKRHYDLSSVTHLLCWGSPHIRNTICDRTKTIYNKRHRLGVPQNKEKKTTLHPTRACECGWWMTKKSPDLSLMAIRIDIHSGHQSRSLVDHVFVRVGFLFACARYDHRAVTTITTPRISSVPPQWKSVVVGELTIQACQLVLVVPLLVRACTLQIGKW